MTTAVVIKNNGEEKQVVARWATRGAAGELVLSNAAIILDPGYEETVYLHSGNMVVIEER